MRVSLLFCFLSVSLSAILFLMLSGSRLWCAFIFPLGMLCLSARSMMSVNVLFAECTSVGSSVFSSACSMSLLYLTQSAFL